MANPPLAHHSEHSETQSLTNAYNDDRSSNPSAELIRKPTNSFDEQDPEDAFVGRRTRPRGSSWWAFKDIMTARARRKLSIESTYKDDISGSREGLLAVDYAFPVPAVKRKSSWYNNYCIFGGISGLAILAFLLVLNLLLTFLTLYWSSDLDSTLQNWGQPGSGTEGLAWYPTDFTRDVLPIRCHSHNDYWRRVPLFSAIRAGCTGVEADVWLFDNELYVGHNTASLTRNRTFTSLYVDPLVNILEKQNPKTDFYNGTSHGVFDTDGGQTLTLLIDVKTGGKETWPWVLEQLQPLRERGWLSFVENEQLHIRPITVVGTGNTPFNVLTANTTYRDAFFDAPLDTMWESRHQTEEMVSWPNMDDSIPGESLFEGEGSAEEEAKYSSNIPHNRGQGLSGTTPDSQFTNLNSYYASVSLKNTVGRIWRSRLSNRQMRIIRGQIRGAHRRGLKVRYWDTPSWPIGLRNHVWDVLIKEGADMLNVDDLRGASKVVW